MFKEMAQLGQLLGQARTLSGRMQEVQANLAKTTVQGVSSNGFVTIDMTCDQRVTACRIEPSCLTVNAINTLESSVVEATNQALDKARQTATEQMKELTGGMDLGAMQGMLGSR